MAIRLTYVAVILGLLAMPFLPRALAGEKSTKGAPDAKPGPAKIAPVAQTSFPFAISRVVFTPDDKLLALACADGAVRIGPPTRSDFKVFVKSREAGTPLGEIFDIAFSPDGTLLAMASEQGVRLVDFP